MRRSFTRWALSLALAALVMGGILVQAARAQEPAGDWHGVLRVGGVELRIGATITAKPGGGYEGRLSSPDQGPGSLPLDSVTLDGDRLTFALAAIRGTYEGRWDATREAWVGTWTQGAPLPLVLEKGPVPSLARPQEPKKPYPYREEDVAFDSAPGVKLAGTLTLPSGKGPFPAAVLVSGSGPQDRDESLLGHRPFLVIADHLTRQGIAVLRYDDRGFGKSTGAFITATSRDFADDAAAAVAFLRTRPEIAGAKIGVIGHSEGGMIAPMVATQDPKLGWIVLLAGPGAPSRELMSAQREAVMKVMGAPPERIAEAAAVMARVDDAVLAAKTPADARAEVIRLLAGTPGAPPAAAAMQAGQVSTAWYRYFIAYDPAPTLAKVRQPILALNGENDLQVVAGQNLPAIRAATRANRDVTVVELPGLNHLFQSSATGAPSEYGRIEETFSPKALEMISTWIKAHAR